MRVSVEATLWKGVLVERMKFIQMPVFFLFLTVLRERQKQPLVHYPVDTHATDLYEYCQYIPPPGRPTQQHHEFYRLSPKQVYWGIEAYAELHLTVEKDAMIEEDRAKKEEERLATQQELMKAMVAMQEIMMIVQGLDAARLAIQSAYNVAKMSGIGLQVLENRKKKMGLGASLADAAIETFKSGSKIPFLVGIPLAIAAIAGLYTMVNNAMTKGFAEGGMVGKDGGPVATTDTVPAMLTPGEIVLNKAQQRNVASSVVGGSTKALESKMDSQIKETKEANKNSAKLLEQNQILMSKLIRETGNLKLQNL